MTNDLPPLTRADIRNRLRALARERRAGLRATKAAIAG